MLKLQFLLVALFLLTGACTSIVPPQESPQGLHEVGRTPTGDAEPQALEKVFRDLYEADEAVRQAQLALDLAPRSNGMPFNNGPSLELENAIRNLTARQSQLADLAKWAGQISSNLEGSLAQHFFALDRPIPRKLMEKLELRDLSTYLPQKKAFFIVPIGEVQDYQLSILNRIPGMNFDAKLSCDGTFDLAVPGLFNNVTAKKEAAFWLENRDATGNGVVFVPGPELTHCELRFENKNRAKSLSGVVKFVKAADRFPQLASYFRSGFEGCLLPSPVASGPEGFFLSTRFQSFSCPVESGFETLPASIDALQAKVEALLGRRLSQDFLKANDPFGKLDFSQMPQLDSVFISSLVFQADFSGTILKRLLEEHARRGALVRIVVAEITTRGKHRAALDDLMAKHSNVSVQYFKWHDVGSSGTGFAIASLYRVVHMKLFVTLSARHPEHNQLIMGGRNIHDGFAFSTARDLSRFANLVTYGKDNEDWASWRDFEVRSRSQALIESLVHHFNLFWLRDSEGFGMSNSAVALAGRGTTAPLQADKVYVRHLMSVPYKDSRQLEEFFESMFDNAKRSIVITSPYFGPTKKLGNALRRAAERGVKIQVVTRFDLTGDSGDFILGDANKQGVNALMNAAEMYDYAAPGEILHAKIVLIDDELSFVGSANLDKKSFVHDVQSGLLVYNRAFNAQMLETVQGFIGQSRSVEEKLKVNFWKKVLIGLLGNIL